VWLPIAVGRPVPVGERFLLVATDWLVYYMMQPAGLMLVGLAIAIPFVFWRLILGNTFAGVGFTPLVIAYTSALLGVLVANFMSSYLDFSHRVAIGLLEEGQRWSLVPGWTIYRAVLSLIFLLPLLAIVGVPLSAVLLRKQRLTYASIAAMAVALWLVLALVGWAMPNKVSFFDWLRELLPGIVLVVVPFFVGIRVSLRSPRPPEY